MASFPLLTTLIVLLPLRAFCRARLEKIAHLCRHQPQEFDGVPISLAALNGRVLDSHHALFRWNAGETEAGDMFD